MGNSVDATRAFHEVIESKVKRVALVDTFGDEKFESIAVAEAMGDVLYGVRLDTPSSRRGNFLKILEEVRWELDLRGYSDVKLFVSGGLDEDKIAELNPVVDAYGIGTSISSAKVIDFAMDITEVEGKPLAKRGKMSGSKRVMRCDNCFDSRMVPFGVAVSTQHSAVSCPCGGVFRDILLPFVENGRVVGHVLSSREIREYVLNQLKHFSL
jgi:nicotinate phosphoribosyltransferase